MHFAAIAYVSESVKNPLKYYQNITTSTVNLLDCMGESGVSNLVYSSTCATYGNPSELPITESTTPQPVNPYGKAKLMSEDIIRDLAKSNPDFKVGILRYFNVYGSDESGTQLHTFIFYLFLLFLFSLSPTFGYEVRWECVWLI